VFSDRDPTVAQQALADAKDSARQALAEVRQSVAALRDNGSFSLSEGTVKNHVSNILSRLGLRDRTLAAIYARDRNLL
jgi:signal transduction histidine kinase